MSPPEPVVLRGVSLFDGVTSGLQADRTVICVGDRIDWVGPTSAEPRVGPGAIVFDEAGRVLVPGLIDCHVHLSADGGTDFAGQLVSDTIPRAVLRAWASGNRLLASGVTTVRDCGAANDVVIELGRAIEDGLVAGPRVLAAGRVITMTGGHCFFVGRESDGEDGVRAATRAEIKAGAAFIKVMATGGVLTKGVSPNQVALTERELRVIVEEAHNAGKKVTAHAIGNVGIKNALRAGVDSIEHGFHFDEEAIQLALNSGAYLVPTLRALDADLEHEDALEPWLAHKAHSESGYHQASFRSALGATMKIAAGTDAGTPFNPPGELVRELETMVRLGMTAEQALLSATRYAAANIDRSDTIGTVEVGKCADLLLLEADPLQDVGALRATAAIISRGQVLVGLITR